MSREWMLPRVIQHCRTPATVLELAQRMKTSVPSAATLALRYARAGHLEVVGKRQTALHGRPAKVYQTVKR
jgi:predicted ArsR family transcriptional regulator